MAQRDLTRAAEILAGKGGTKGPFRDGEWNSGTARDTQQPIGQKGAPALDSLVPLGDGTERNNVSVPLFHPPLGVERGTRGTADDVQTTSSSCTRCVHVTPYGNCGEPVAAGLVEHFGIVRHPADGRGCVAFAAREPAGDPRAPAHFSIGDRLARLRALGAIDQADAELVRERFDARSAGEWLALLDWCEAAVCDGAPACEAASPCVDRAAAGRQVAADAEKRASGPISPASRPSAEVPSARDLDSKPPAVVVPAPTHVLTQQPGAERSLFD
jgi:hypothetical protein